MPAEIAAAATELKGTLSQFVQMPWPRDSLSCGRISRLPGDMAFRTPATLKSRRHSRSQRVPSGTALCETSPARTPTSGRIALACSAGCLRQESASSSARSRGSRCWTTCTPRPQRENNNPSSGFLVPDEFQNDLIDLRENFGVFRQNAKIVPMAADTRSDPRRVNGVTAYFVGESSAASLPTSSGIASA